MLDDITRRYSSFTIMYSALLLAIVSSHCSKPALSKDTHVVALRSDVNLTCPGCGGQVWWSRGGNLTMKLQDGPHLSLTSFSYEDEDNYTCYRAGTPGCDPTGDPTCAPACAPACTPTCAPACVPTGDPTGAPACTVQLLVRDDLEKPKISCYIRHPTHNITCDWQTTRELRPHATVKLIAWRVNGAHGENGCSYDPSTGKFTCSTPYVEGDSGRHTLSLCVIGRTGHQTSNTVDATIDHLMQPDPPINVAVSSLEGHPRKLWVSWSPPRSWLGNFYKLQYQVQYWVEGSPHVSNGTTEGTQFVIHDALARRRHVTHVRAQEEFVPTWSTWSDMATATPWSEEEDEPPPNTEFPDLILTSPEDEHSPTNAETSSAPIPRYVWFVSGTIFALVFLLFLGILMRNREVKLLQLKGGLLRTLFQPSRSAPALPPPVCDEPLLMAPCAPPLAVTITDPKPRDAE